MKVSLDTIARTIVMVMVLLNQCLALFGRGTIDVAENDVYQVVTLLGTIGASLWAWWKNNSFTRQALKADAVLRELRDGEKERDEL